MNARRILVTGGAGFIGSHLVQRCVALGARVRVFDDLSTGRLENLAGVEDSVELERGDVRDAAALARAARGCEVLFHLAARASVAAAQDDPAGAHEVNAGGALHALLAARAAGARRLVFASTCALYGDGAAEVQHEDAPPRPGSTYAIQKLCGELYCREFALRFGLPCAALRLFNVYGPRQDPRGAYAAVVPRFLAAARAREPLSIFGDGEQSRDFVYVGDVVHALLAAAEAPGAGQGAPLNVGSGRALRIRELCDALEALLGRRLERVHAAVRPGDVRHSRASLERARTELGWSPEVEIAEGLRLTASALGG